MDDFINCVQSIFLLIVSGILTLFTQQLHWYKCLVVYANLQVNVNRNISGGLWFKIRLIGRDGSFWFLLFLAQGVSTFRGCMWVWIWLAILGPKSYFLGGIHVIGSNKQWGAIQIFYTCRIWNLRQLQPSCLRNSLAELNCYSTSFIFSILFIFYLFRHVSSALMSFNS